ncbi:dolichyldiphosphatase 1-like [Saccoglossus kowalevskii]|uniref:Dolichyldiphosphatase n=1 Tax=Saccoglossus kowalevskii TaxID=10224 RepID=A0ABM0MF82_SACKO|nr:PREDICTED: dolichyldiphosphatase 1-like [Saccoglossus kowalevskii]
MASCLQETEWNLDSPAKEVVWKPVSLTHVVYPEGDFVGKCFAWFSLLPVFIIVSFVTLIAFRRELHTITFFGGLLVNEIVNWVLKNIIRQPRPCREHEVVFSEYGMPSNHSQFMWFFGVYLVLFVYIRIQYSTSSTCSLVDLAWKHVVAVGALLVAAIVTYSRVYLHYHTNRQVYSGAVVGSLVAVLWFIFTQLVLTPLFPVVVSWPLSERLMLRDSTLIPNVLWFEYASARAEARARQRKLQ